MMPRLENLDNSKTSKQSHSISPCKMFGPINFPSLLDEYYMLEISIGPKLYFCVLKSLKKMQFFLGFSKCKVVSTHMYFDVELLVLIKQKHCIDISGETQPKNCKIFTKSRIIMEICIFDSNPTLIAKTPKFYIFKTITCT